MAPGSFTELWWILVTGLVIVVGFLIRAILKQFTERIAALEGRVLSIETTTLVSVYAKMDELRDEITAIKTNYMDRFATVNSGLADAKSAIMGELGSLRVDLAGNFVKRDECDVCKPKP